MKLALTTDIFDKMADDGTRKDLAPGTAQFVAGYTRLIFVCPCGCGKVRSIPVGREQSPRCWQWDGDREAPTLTPSVRVVGECGWHGFLTAGEWRAV